MIALRAGFHFKASMYRSVDSFTFGQYSSPRVSRNDPTSSTSIAPPFVPDVTYAPHASNSIAFTALFRADNRASDACGNAHSPYSPNDREATPDAASFKRFAASPRPNTHCERRKSPIKLESREALRLFLARRRAFALATAYAYAALATARDRREAVSSFAAVLDDAVTPSYTRRQRARMIASSSSSMSSSMHSGAFSPAMTAGGMFSTPVRDGAPTGFVAAPRDRNASSVF
mmetsp:Transcript_8404/g.31244  ORF Transcript_8404/g.31244 Transcript_8404/m.31244 type:complete len:232 (-) Transcript_8404:62-757(-)